MYISRGAKGFNLLTRDIHAFILNPIRNQLFKSGTRLSSACSSSSSSESAATDTNHAGRKLARLFVLAE